MASPQEFQSEQPLWPMPGLPAGFQSVPAHSGASAAAGFGFGASATNPTCSAAACRSTTSATAPVDVDGARCSPFRLPLVLEESVPGLAGIPAAGGALGAQAERRKEARDEWCTLMHCLCETCGLTYASCKCMDDESFPSSTIVAFAPTSIEGFERACANVLPSSKKLYLIMSCGLDLHRGNMDTTALHELLQVALQTNDLQALPPRNAVLYVGNIPVHFILDLRPLIGGRQKEYGRRGESVTEILQRLKEEYPEQMDLCTFALAEHTETTGVGFVGCKSGNHRARSVLEACRQMLTQHERCSMTDSHLVLVHLSALFPKHAAYSPTQRKQFFDGIRALIAKALQNYTGRVSDLRCQKCSARGAQRYSTDLEHFCSVCSTTQCTDWCVVCRTKCSRGPHYHVWHYCAKHRDRFTCRFPCANHPCEPCVKRNPDHASHSCSFCESSLGKG